MKQTSLAADWPQQLRQAGPEQQLLLLRQIETLARDEADAWQAVLPLCQSADFALRLRAHLALGRLGQPQAFLPLVQRLQQEQCNLWRLLLLDALLLLPQQDKITPLAPLLAEDQPQDEDAFFLAGLTWFVGRQGPQALPLLSRCLLQQPARARRLKDELLFEAVWLAANGQKERLLTAAQEDGALWRFCLNRVWPRDFQPHFGIYPNPDYLWQKAQAEGLSQSQFKALFYRHRHKQPLKQASEPS